jgi:hypothetical protein
MNTYKFTALCKSGEYKTTTFQADNYREARKKLDEFIENN